MHGFIHTFLPREDDNGASQGRRALVVTAVLTTISTVIVAMRFYARLGLMKITGREDWAILISLVCPSRAYPKFNEQLANKIYVQTFSIIYLALVAAREFKIHW